MSANESHVWADRHLRFERVAIALLFALAFLWFPPAGDPIQAPRVLLAAVAVVLIALAAGATPDTKDARSRLAILGLAALVVLLVVSAIANGIVSGVWGVHGRFEGLVFWFAVASVGIAGWLLGSRANGRWICQVAAAAGAVQVLVVLYQLLMSAEPVGSNSNRVMTGGWLAVCAALAITGAMLERGPMRWWLGAAGAASVVALGVVGSRGAWVGLVLGLVPIVWARRKAWRVTAAVAVLALVLVVAGALVAGGESLQKLDPRTLLTASASARASIWSGTVSMIAERPLLGVGPGRYLYEFPQFEPLAHARIEPDVRADQAHSHLLQLTAEAGVLAGLAWLALVVAVAAAAVNALRARDPVVLALAAGFAAYIGQGLFGIFAMEIDALGWLLGGMLLARSATLRQPQDGQPRKWTRIVVGATSGVIAIACAYYVVADVQYGRGLDAFAAGDMSGAADFHAQASSANPLVDTYRVGYSDAAQYLAGLSGSGEPLLAADSLLDRGLQLEPASYDLALASARVARTSASDIQEVADRYELAAALYPMGLTVRQEAMPVMVEAGRTAEAKQMASDVLRISPNHPTALAVMGEFQ